MRETQNEQVTETVSFKNLQISTVLTSFIGKKHARTLGVFRQSFSSPFR